MQTTDMPQFMGKNLVVMVLIVVLADDYGVEPTERRDISHMAENNRSVNMVGPHHTVVYGKVELEQPEQLIAQHNQSTH